MQVQKADQWIKTHKSEVNQKYRLKYHFMSEVGWINDPNGFSFYNNAYHLFYQFHPYSSKWGPMHWGHAISTDLIKWSHQKVALEPDSPWDCNGCFSGTTLVEDNTIYLFYTGHIDTDNAYFQVQNLAYSNDGIHFQKYEKNPIIDTSQVPELTSKTDFRDPKIIAKNDVYYILVASKSQENVGQIICYRSEDRFKWNFLNVYAVGDKDLGDMWECPDLFKLSLDVNEDMQYCDDSIDVLMISPQNMPNVNERFNNLHSSIFIIGKSDLEVGVFEQKTYYEIDCGFDFYAPQTVTTSSGEVILIAWMDMWESPKPTDNLEHGWVGAMTLPRVLTYKAGKIYSNPVEAIKNYRAKEICYDNVRIHGVLKFPNFYGNCYEMKIHMDLSDLEELAFSCYLRVSDAECTLLQYCHEEHTLTLDRNNSGISLSGQRKIIFDKRLKELKLRIFVDISSIEIFINDGEYTMTSRIFPSEASQGILFYSNQNYVIKSIKKWDIET